MKSAFPSFKIFNRNILLMEWEADIDQNQMQLIGQFATLLKNQCAYLFTDIVPAYHSLTVYYKDDISQSIAIIDQLKTLYVQLGTDTMKPGKLWKIPVVYGGSHGPDADSVCKALDMGIHELISKHTEPVYDVHFIGFLPGFPYMGGLDPALHIARKSVPSVSTLAGSVAIGGGQTGIYPVNSPGGWHVLGHTPFPLFDIKRSPAIIIQSQDQIQFFPIQESEIEDYRHHLQNEIAGIYEN